MTLVFFILSLKITFYFNFAFANDFFFLMIFLCPPVHKGSEISICQPKYINNIRKLRLNFSLYTSHSRLLSWLIYNFLISFIFFFPMNILQYQAQIFIFLT